MVLSPPWSAILKNGALLGSLIPSHATGLKSVPYNGYIARLHKGESVVPANQVAQQSSKPTLTINGGINIGAGNSVTMPQVETALINAFSQFTAHLAT